MQKLKPPKIDKLFEGFKLQLKNEGQYFSNLSDHNGEKGRLNESHLKKVLRQFLPEKYGIGTGFIVSSESLDKKDNPQLDIIIYDKLNNAPLYQSEAFGIYPVEMVYAYIEVKTTLTKGEIDSAFKANTYIRNIANNKQYMGLEPINLAPRFYIFAYNSKPKDKVKLTKHIENAFNTHEGAHAHGIYTLDKDLLVARKAYAKKVELITKSHPLTFAIFITNIINHCETMIPTYATPDGMNLPPYLTLPRVNLQKYFG